MAVATEIETLKTNIANAYNSIGTKGGTIPTNKNTENLSSAIESITTGGGGDFSEYFTTPLKVGDTYTSGFNNSLQKIPDGLTLPTDSSYFFSYCRNLKNVSALNTLTIPTSINMSRMFQFSGITSIPDNIFTPTNLQETFYTCSSLTTLPQMNTSNCTTMASFCRGCSKITSFPTYDTSKVQIVTNMCNSCSALTTIPLLDWHLVRAVSSAFLSCPALTTLGGFQNYGQAFGTNASANASSFTLNLSASTNLTEQSLINVLTNLYDIATKGVKTQTIQLGATNLAKLTSTEGQAALTQAQNYGWTIS